MTSLRNVLLAVVVAGSLLSFAPAPAQADDYWDGYWGWYDTTYVPGYSRYYSYSRPYYGGRYYDDDYYYGRPYYGRSYGPPRAGYIDYGGRAGASNSGHKARSQCIFGRSESHSGLLRKGGRWLGWLEMLSWKTEPWVLSRV